jgi:class 3 adenylate cyclase
VALALAVRVNAPVALLQVTFLDLHELALDVGPHGVACVLDHMFARFEDAVQRHGVTRVAAAGTGLLACHGAPLASHPFDSARAVARCALDVLAAVDEVVTLTGKRLRARAGVHMASGVLTGIVGGELQRFQLFGPALDELAAVEASGAPMAVHASAAAASALRVCREVAVGEFLADGSAYLVDCEPKSACAAPPSHSTPYVPVNVV